MSLTLKEYTHNEELTLAEFLYLFLTHLNEERDTLNDRGEIQCFARRFRSLGDITAICRSYYPNVTMAEVKDTLLNFGTDLRGHFCLDIGKRVYIYEGVGHLRWGQGSTNKRDEFGDAITYRQRNTNVLNMNLIRQIRGF